MLKNVPRQSLEAILKLYNNIWAAGSLPKAWKHAIVLPFIKPGKDPTSPNSYRPIALTSALCKIMERMVTNRLNWYLENNDLFNPMQTGFR
jgi:potassium voltage-gated channel Eag-related subfamily H protein 8